MRRLFPSSVFLAAALMLPAVATAQSKRAITVDDLLSLHRVSDPQIAPDGSRVVYTVATPDRQANRVGRSIWIVPTAGGTSRQLTFTGRDGGARWSPDGSRLAFLSSRDGAQQIYLLNLTGGEPTKLTSLDGGADQIVWAPDGKTPGLHLVGVARLRRRRVQQAQDRGQREGPGESADLRRPALPPLDRLGHRSTVAPVHGGRAAARRETSRRAPATTCRPCNVKGRIRSRSRRMAARLPLSRSPTQWRPSAPTATSSS